MSGTESPGALAARGASEIDQLGGKVDPKNSPTDLVAQARPLRAGNATKLCGLRFSHQRAAGEQTAKIL
jgi:hypothetical protein